jgi:hypothetical protein
MDTDLMVRTAREFAAIASRRFPEVADCDFRESFLKAILNAVSEETIMVDLHADTFDLM